MDSFSFNLLVLYLSAMLALNLIAVGCWSRISNNLRKSREADARAIVNKLVRDLQDDGK